LVIDFKGGVEYGSNGYQVDKLFIWLYPMYNVVL